MKAKITNSQKLITVVLFVISVFSLNSSKASDYYWVGGTGNWSDYANHWATTSGGVIFHTTIPSPFDDVYFDINSFAATGDTVSLDSTIINCHNMDWTGVTNNPVFIGPSSLKIYGSLTLVSGMTWVPFSIGLSFNASTTGNTLTSAGQYLTSILFDNPAGGWTLNDSLNTYGLHVNSGTFATNNHNVHCFDFFAGQLSVSKATVSLGSSVITSKFSWTAQDTSFLTLDAASATIIITNNVSAPSDGFFGGSHQVYGDVTCNKVQGDDNSYQNVYVPYIGAIDGTYNTFNDVFFTTDGFFVTNNSTAHNIYFPATGRIGYNNIINKVIFADDAIIDGSTLDTLIFNNPGKTISFGGTNTINNELNIANGTCNNFTFIKSTQTGSQATISKPNGNVTVDYAQLQDINATGGATFTANNSIDAGNVTGWTINTLTPKNLYWVGGAGDWSDNNHWAITSGGAGGNCMPTQFDNVFFDANSFSLTGDTLQVNATIINCYNMDWTGVTNNPVFIGPSSLKIYGSLTLVSGMTWVPFSIGLSFNASTTGNTLTSAGQYLTSILFDNPAGGWTLNDSLNTYGLHVNSGTFATNNHNVHCFDFFAGQLSVSKATVSLGSSVITSKFSWTAQDTSFLTLDAASATIIITNNVSAPSDGFFGGSHQVYGDVTCNKVQGDDNSYQNVYVPYIGAIDGTYNTFNDVFFTTDGFFVTNNSTAHNIYFPATGRIGYNNIINKVIFADDAIIDGSTLDTLIFNNPGKTISFGGTNTINNELNIANGTCNNFTFIKSTQTGSQATISKPNGNVTVDYAQLQDINATGGATFTANNSIDAGNVTGWTINTLTPKNLYWVGGAGDWSDNNHWAITSGGAGGNCMPTQFDNVFFDANSFSLTGDTLQVNATIINCYNMDWTGVTNNPVFIGPSSLKIYGSLTLVSGMTWVPFSIGLSFNASTTGNTLTSAGQYLTSILFDNPAGGWTLNDSLNTYGLHVNSGTFATNNHNVHCFDFFAGQLSVSKATVSLGSSVITSKFSWTAQDTSFLTLDAASATIIITNNVSAPSDGFFGGSHQVYGDVTCNKVQGDDNSYQNVYVPYIGAIDGTYNTFNDVFFTTDGFFVTNNSTAHNIYFPATGRIGYNNIINKVIFADDAIIDGSTLDTLIFNNPGKTISFGGTNTINNELNIANGLPGFPTSVHSTSTGIQSTISLPSDTVCTDYLYMQDINATGGGVFYAGANSIDLGNNTGWLWSNCTPDTSNVWPGDANYDLTADNIDVLYIGLAYGYTGATRAGATTNWVAQPAVDWLQQFANGTNIKHADCDGNGTVNATDTLAVSLNYGLVHPFKNPTPPLPNNFGADLYFDMPTGALTPGTTVSIPIMFGTSLVPASNIYGIGFTINYDPTLIQANTMQIDFSNSWLGTSANTIHLTKDFPLNGTIDMGYVKTDHLNSNGNGTIATLTFTVANNASGFLNLSFSDILVLDRNEFPIPVNAQAAVIYTSIDEQPSIESMINVYPNPASTSISITDANHIIQNVKLTDMTGREIIVKQNFDNVLLLDVSKVIKGIYLLSIETKNGILNKKIQIIH